MRANDSSVRARCSKFFKENIEANFAATIGYDLFIFIVAITKWLQCALTKCATAPGSIKNRDSR